MVKPLCLYLVLNLFNPYIVLDVSLLFHAWTDLKFIFPDLVCRKGVSQTKKQSLDSPILWWCLEIIGVKGILAMVLW